jgi:signal transduction histidine kinase
MKFRLPPKLRKLKVSGEWANLFLWGGVIFNLAIIGYFYYTLSLTAQRVQGILFHHLQRNLVMTAEGIASYLRDSCKDANSIYHCFSTHPERQRELSILLRFFRNTHYSHIYVLTKRDFTSRYFVYLADREFKMGKPFLPEEKNFKYWQQLYTLKKPLFFPQRDVHGVSFTFLYPVIKNGKVDAVIVIDCSMEVINQVTQTISQLWGIGKIEIIMALFLVIITGIVLFINRRLLREKRALMESLQEKNQLLTRRIAKEIRQKEETEKQLLLQSRLAMMGELLRIIAHQWRQPLNSLAGIVTNLELRLLMGDLDKRELQKELTSLKKSIKQLDSIITDFQKFYHRQQREEAVRIPSIVEEVLSFGSFTFRERGIKIIKKYECSKPVKTHPRELQQVVFNILKNSEEVLIHRRVKNPVIEIGIYPENGWCVISIKDNGGGIDREVLPKIFDPYFTTKQSKNGVGLGLYMGKMIVEKSLQGKLLVTNWEEGAEFQILIPLKEEENE